MSDSEAVRAGGLRVRGVIVSGESRLHPRSGRDNLGRTPYTRDTSIIFNLPYQKIYTWPLSISVSAAAHPYARGFALSCMFALASARGHQKR